MGKKTEMCQYTTLSDIDHKMQFINIVAVINSISPTIKRSKLTEVVLEVSDATMYNPGFVVKLQMKSEILSEFLVIGKRGLIVELQEIKVIKNEGVVYGEVREEEELKLYNDKATCIRWFSEEEFHPVSDELRCSIKDLSQWKKMHFTDSIVINEDFSDDTRRSRLSNPQSNQVITYNVSERNSTNNINSLQNKSPEKRCTDVKTQNNTISSSQKKNSLKTMPSSDFDNSKSASTKRNSEQINQSQHQKKLSVGKVLSQCNVYGEGELSTGNSSATTSGDLSNNSGINVNLGQEKNTKKSKSSKNVKNRDLSPDSVVSEICRFSEENATIREYSTLSEIPLRRCDSPNSNEDIKSIPKVSKKYSSSTKEQKETETNISKFKNNENEEKQTLQSDKIVESSRNSVRDNENSFQKKDSPRSVLSKTGNSGKDDSVRSLRSKQNISIDNLNKSIGDENGSFKSDDMSDKSSNISNSEKSYEKIHKQPRKRQCASDESEVESDNSKRTNHENVNKPLRKRQYTSDENEIESDVSNKSKRKINSPLRKIIKNITNLKRKSKSFESSLNMSERSVTNMKIPALNSSDSSVSNSERSLIDSSSDKKRVENSEEKSAQTQTTSITQKYPKDKNIGKLESKKAENQISSIDVLENVSKNSNTLSHPTNKDDKRKLTRRSMTKINLPVVDPGDEFEKLNPIFFYIKSITRKVNLKQVESLSDISMSNLEEIDVPEKFDLECKVISEFTLIEDNIQVIRVQDGSMSKKTLIIPECSSWDGVIEMILNNPIVMENSPFVDIIIFDYSRMDKVIKAGNFYRFRNIMAVKFCLKFDPRIKADKKGELFFCLKGQNAYVTKASQTAQNEIKERLEEDTYKNVWNQTFQDMNAENRSSPTSETVNIGSDEHISSLEGFKEIYELHETDSQKTRKRKLKDSEIKNKEKTFKTPKNNSDQVEVSTEKNIEPHGCTKQGVEGSTNQFKINSTTSSDETVLGETPALLRELREIMHEESVLGMPLTSTEDIHLKNTGSEITYSQFRIGADEKTLNFRTSTQLDSISQAVVPSNCEELTQTEECSKMEPLVYCPSGSSLCSGLEVSPLKDKTVSEDPKCQEECSESILHNYKTGQNLDVEVNKICLKTGIETDSEKKIINDKKSDISVSPSVNSVSSDSSVLEVAVVQPKRLQKDQNMGPDNKQSEPQLDSLDTQVCKSSGRNNSTKYVPEQIEVIDNSSNDSLLSVFNSTTIKQRSSCNMSVSHSSPFVHNVEQNRTNRVVKNILPSCYFKSSVKTNLIEEDATNIVDENDTIKYMSYSRDQSLPFLNLSLLNKLIYQNYLKVAVFIVKITPPLTGSWQEKCVKARCPNCDKLFDVYNAANNKYSENTSSAALSVGSHIVCPDSECCNQILENPEFQISVEIKLKDGTPLSALIGAQHAEEVLGCTAQEAITDKKKFDKVAEILKKLESKISNDHLTLVHLTRKNVCDPKSGPLYIQKMYI